MSGIQHGAFELVQVVKNPPANAGDRRDIGPWAGKIPWRRAGESSPIFLPGEPHGQRSLAGYGPWVHRETDMTEQLSTYY